jgi:hypothetical protein
MGRIWTIARIDPQAVRFTQQTVGYRFRDGTTIDDLAESLRTGRIDPDDVPPIRIFERGGLLFTLDNRRLEAFRRARVDIPFRRATPREVISEGWKLTTTTEGRSIRIRGETS